MSYFVVGSVERTHGIFCGEDCGVAVGKNTCHILWRRVWSGCEEEYMSYFVVNSVEWL